jgi:hypothetical protein
MYSVKMLCDTENVLAELLTLCEIRYFNAFKSHWYIGKGRDF